MRQDWTTAQAAFLLNKPIEAIKKAIERGPVKPRVARAGGVRTRRLALGDLVFLHAEDTLKAELTPRGRAELYSALVKDRRTIRSEVSFGDVTIKLFRHIHEIEARLRELEQLSSEIEIRTGKALIKGTQIEAYRIAALLEAGMSVEAVLQDYPSLGENQLRAARAYAVINPKIGRPYPKMTAKAALRNSGLDVLDDEV
ncbi:DUF433 domain-containing protein [Labrys sp. LIt4]|uniref:DUF433 domain-containing protein n=1 Tax=Labrys sp. LIt4 TaxID=2821355 RepID=UPI001AE0DE07|nr:DUF433 domain-containing protein [Labrys sp. LIt4]MBP0579670.1 DUF433 domain-containing protein [Labrys sp. LIt4]